MIEQRSVIIAAQKLMQVDVEKPIARDDKPAQKIRPFVSADREIAGYVQDDMFFDDV